jgi:TPR repeat protein
MIKYLFPLFLLTLMSATLTLSGCSTTGTATTDPSVLMPADVEALYNQGIAHYKQNDFSQAAEKYRKAAELGHAKAQYELAALYRFGSGVPKDLNQATHWYSKAAEQDNVDAQLSLGVMYYKGIEIPQDLQQAEKWLERAVNLDNRNAIGVLEKVRYLLVK